MVRQKKNIPLKPITAILVEGETEEEYFHQLAQIKNWSSAIPQKIDILSGNGDYVDKADRMLQTGKKLKGVQIPKKIIVFDANHQSENQLNTLVKKAIKHGYIVAFSNASFEVWLLAHFQPMTSGLIDERELTRKLTKALGKPYKKSDSNQIATILKGLESAHVNTERINKLTVKAQSTTVGDVIKKLYP